jgi:hypothetical protein
MSAPRPATSTRSPTRIVSEDARRAPRPPRPSWTNPTHTQAVVGKLLRNHPPAPLNGGRYLDPDPLHSLPPVSLLSETDAGHRGQTRFQVFQGKMASTPLQYTRRFTRSADSRLAPKSKLVCQKTELFYRVANRRVAKQFVLAFSSKSLCSGAGRHTLFGAVCHRVRIPQLPGDR